MLTSNLDPTCMLLPPRRNDIEKTLYRRIKSCLATQFDTTVNRVSPLLERAAVWEFGKVQRLEGGDTMHASSLVPFGDDRRDASFVRVSPLQTKYSP